jgi:hypothetical protein
MKSVDNKFQSVMKSFLEKLFSKLMKKCSKIVFLKLVPSLKKSFACVKHNQIIVLHILL